MKLKYVLLIAIVVTSMCLTLMLRQKLKNKRVYLPIDQTSERDYDKQRTDRFVTERFGE